MELLRNNISEFEFTIISHHQRSIEQSPCTSIFNLFLAPTAPYSPAEHFHLGVDKLDKLNIKHSNKNRCFIFNSFASLTKTESFDVVTYALKNSIKIIIYWHETAWNLRDFMQRDEVNFSLIRTYISTDAVHHWVPTFQNAQILMLLFGISLESIDVIFETIDMKKIQTLAGIQSPIAKTARKFIGAGLPNSRKGFDLFNELAKKFDGEYEWYTPRESSILPKEMILANNVNWKGYVKNFPNAIKDADIFLLTSRDDPSPIVCLEALSLGIPVFAFGTTGYSEILPKEFVCSHIDDMAEKIQSFLDIIHLYSRDFFKSIAKKHDVSSFILKLKKRKSIRIKMPNCTDSALLGHENGLIQKLASSLKELNNTSESLRSWRDTYKNRARQLANFKENLSAEIKSKQDEVETSHELQIQSHKDYVKYLKLAHKESRIEIKKEFRTLFNIEYNIKPKKVIVIGNSPSVLDSDHGKFIDSCDVVFRINNFEIKGYEKNVGEKVDYIIFTPACLHNTYISSINQSKRLLHLANFHSDRKKAQERMLQHGAVGIKIYDTICIPQSLYFFGLTILMGLDHTTWASTGSVALQLAMDLFPDETNLYFTGIDFFNGGTTEIKHYFNHTTKLDGVHNVQLERNYFEKYISSGRLIAIH